MKRVFVFLFALLLSATALFAGGSRQQGTSGGANTVARGVGDWKYKYPQTVTATIGRSIGQPNYFDGESYENNAYTKWIKDTYNYEIKIGFLTSDADWTQRVTLAIASGDLPDLMQVTDRRQLVELMESGMVEDLTGLFDQWASPLFKAIIDTHGGLENAMSSTFLNGRQYAYSTTICSGLDSLFWVREDWRLRLGLPEPRTIDDFVRLAQAFVDNDMAGNRRTSGLEISSGIAGGYNGILLADPFFNEVGAYPKLWVDDGNGKIVYGSVAPQAKEGLRALRDLYARGIIPRDFATKDNVASVAAGEVGVLTGPWWIPDYPLNFTMNNDPNAIWKVYNWTSEKTGRRHSFRGNPNSGWIVARKGFSNPELIPRLLNFTIEVRCFFDEVLMHTPDLERNFELAVPANVREAYIGRQGINWTSWPTSIQIDYDTMMPQLAKAERQALESFKAGNTIDASLRISMENIVKYENGDRSYWPWSNYMRYISKQFSLIDEGKVDIEKPYWPYDTDTMQLRWADLVDLETLAYINIIMGEQPLDYFDAFVRQWYDQGGARITEEVNRQFGK